MKLLLDMNLTPRWTETLQNAGFESVHWSFAGAKSAPDTEIMLYAQREGFVVVTQDLDFSTILAASQAEKPSVVQIRADDSRPEKIGEQVIQALNQMTAELEEGALITIDLKRTRVRVLPLTRNRQVGI